MEKTLERIQVLVRRWPDKISGRLVPVLYTLEAEPPPSKKQKSSRHGSSEAKEKVITLEETLRTANGQETRRRRP